MPRCCGRTSSSSWPTERVGVTISIDGPEEMQDKFRVFNNGAGSYAMAAPKIKALLARHRSRPDRRARDADAADARRASHLPPSHRGTRFLGSRLRAGDHRARTRLRDLRRRLRSPARAVPRRLPRTISRRRCRTATTASRTFARRCRSFIMATPRRIRAAPASA